MIFHLEKNITIFTILLVKYFKNNITGLTLLSYQFKDLIPLSLNKMTMIKIITRLTQPVGHDLIFRTTS